MLDGSRGGDLRSCLGGVTDPRRARGSKASFYKWKAKYSGMSVSEATDDSGEVWADMFLGWVYDEWGNDPFGIADYKRDYMNTHM